MNGILSRGALLALSLGMACGGATKSGTAAPPREHTGQAGGAEEPAPTKPSASLDPARQRGRELRDGADLLDKAEEYWEQGNRALADHYFGLAELIVGPEALASLAPRFRAGGPPLVTDPVKQMRPGPPQPEAVGESEKEEPPPPAPPKTEYASLSGVVMIDGKPPQGEIGVVTLEAVGARRLPLPVPRLMEQRNRQFLPHVLVVPVGSPVTFPNWDAVYHNVFSTSAPKSFDLGLYHNGEARTVVFDKEGIVELTCNIHANMHAYIVVVSAPHYSVTGPNGQFRFSRLRPGKYVLRAWNERTSAPVKREVELKAGANSTTVGVAADAPTGPAPDKFGVSRAKKP